MTLCDAFILRISCKYEGLFTNVYNGKSLTGGLLGTFQYTNDACQTACIMSKECKSINVKDNGNDCKLLTNVIGERGSILVEKAGWTHQSTNYQTKNVTVLHHQSPSFQLKINTLEYVRSVAVDRLNAGSHYPIFRANYYPN